MDPRKTRTRNRQRLRVQWSVVLRINVLFLGPAKNFAGAENVSLEIADAATVADLRTLLAERYEGLRRALGTIRFAVNEEFASDETVLQVGDEVALIPPVSGGQDVEPTFRSLNDAHSTNDEGILVELRPHPIPAERVRSFVMGDHRLGGIVTFEGATRREPDAKHGAIVRLDYEAYGAMARRQLERLAVEAKRRWSAGRVAIIHRTGSVPPGEVSVMIAVACGHRAEAFAACRWLIDTLKKEVPIWKEEVFEDGHVRRVNPAKPE